MPRYSARIFTLTPDEERALKRLKRQGPRRKEAGVLLKVFYGKSIKAAAGEAGRTPQTVYTWMQRFEAEGVTMFRQINKSSRGVPLPRELVGGILRLSRDNRWVHNSRNIDQRRMPSSYVLK